MSLWRTTVGVLAVTLAAPSAFAITWPGPAPCNTTLAACITGVASGTVVEIATNGPIDENIFFTNKSLTLRAAAGYKPAFAPGRSLGATATGATAVSVTFDGLTVTDAEVALSRSGTADGTFAVRRMRVVTEDPAELARIVIAANSTGALSFDIAENEVDSRCDCITHAAIDVQAQGPTATGQIRFNKVTSVGHSDANGIRAAASAGSLALDIFANEVRGDFGIGAISVTNAPGASAATVGMRILNNAVVGPGATTGDDSRNGVRVMVGANADVQALVLNNTIVGTRGGLFIGRTVLGTTGMISGFAANNLIAFNGTGFFEDPGASTVSNGYNLVFGNVGNSYTPGPGTVTADPRLLSAFHPRLRAGSPAIDTGDTALIGAVLDFAGLPILDADGMRRGLGAEVDIGAYEFGDASFLAVKTSATGNNFAFDHPAVNGLPGVRPVITKNFSHAAVSDPFAVGTYYFGGLWRAFNQSVSDTMPAGTAMNVFVPGPSIGNAGASYAHVATAGNISGHFTVLDHPFLNDNCGAFVLITNNWNGSGTGVYNNHHAAAGCLFDWFVLNQDFVDMPVDAAFNIYAQDPSPNAYQHTVAAHNKPLLEATTLDHPLLNGVPCAQVQVTQRVGATNDHPYDVYYQGGRWNIYNQDLATLAEGIVFNVLVNPRQVFECTDVIFEDGFQS
jgi:hypothetical protein